MKNILCALLLSAVCATGGWSMDPGDDDTAKDAAIGGRHFGIVQNMEEILGFLKRQEVYLEQTMSRLNPFIANQLPFKQKLAEYVGLIRPKMKEFEDMVAEKNFSPEAKQKKKDKMREIILLFSQALPLAKQAFKDSDDN